MLVNGERVSTHELQNNDLITIGDYDLRYVCTFERDIASVQASQASAAAVESSAPVAEAYGLARPRVYDLRGRLRESSGRRRPDLGHEPA